MKALDLFAGTGWGVACKWLGIEEDGVEIMPEAVATRTANGMNTIFGDVWDGLKLTKEEFEAKHGKHDLLIASPPCQTFSAAGSGAGRKALDEVITAIEEHLYKDPESLKEFGRKHDDRTALVLSPLAYVWRDMPEYVVLEQVPTVQPVWEAYAVVLRDLGYSVETAILNAEQYGVPQTRRRAILVARLHGEARLPKPTHSRYYPRDPARLDPGVQKWVSMAEALGWTEGGTFTQNNKLAHQAIRSMDQPAPTVTAGHDSGNRGFIGADNFQIATPEQVAALQSYPTALRPEIEDWKWKDAPATTVAGDPRITAREHHYHGEQSKTSLRLTSEEASHLQTFPTSLRSNYGTSGDKDNRGERSVDQPAATLTSKANRSLWIYRNGNQEHSAKRTPDQPAPTVHFGQRSNKVEWMTEDGVNDPAASGVRVTPEQASALQSYEKPFVWCGAKTKQYLQIGNAVPPVLAAAVLAAAINPEAVATSRRRRRTLV